MCQQAKTATTVAVKASELLREKREHPSHFSRGKLLDVCGVVHEVDDA